jgi:hypothetical protein
VFKVGWSVRRRSAECWLHSAMEVVWPRFRRGDGMRAPSYVSTPPLQRTYAGTQTAIDLKHAGFSIAVTYSRYD